MEDPLIDDACPISLDLSNVVGVRQNLDAQLNETSAVQKVGVDIWTVNETQLTEPVCLGI